MRSRTYYVIAVVSLILIVVWLHIALLPEGGLFAILNVLSTVNLFWLLPAFGLFGIAYILRAVRWWQLLRPFKTGGNPASLFPIIVGGIFLTYVVPLRAGDIATPYWLREKRGTRFTAGLSSVLLARILDFASLTLIVVLFSVLIFGSVADVMRYIIVGGIIGTAFIGFFLLIRSERFVGALSRILSRLFKPSERLRDDVPKFVENAAIDMRTVISSRNSAGALLTSVPLWILETAKLTFLGLALGVDIPLVISCFAASLSYMGGHASGILLPSGIGIFLFQNITLGIWLTAAGVPASVVASVALLDGLIYIVGLTLLGVPSLASMGRGYRELQEEESKTTDD